MKKWILLGSVPVLLALFLFAVVLFPLFFMGGGPVNWGGYMGGSISEVGESEIPAQYIPIYQAAESRYGVPWNLLAAHHRVETVFSTLNPMISSVGAEGHMQFMPCTFIGWSHPSCGGAGKGNFSEQEKTSLAMIARYGGYGVDGNQDGKADMWDLTDSIFSAANYLAKNGAASGHWEKAIFTYNHSQEYVAEVMKYANLYVLEGFTPIEVMEPSKSGFARPVSGQVTSGFGIRLDPVTGEPGDSHEGIDFACSAGQPIPASRAGTVTMAGWQNPDDPNASYGQFVWVDHGGGYKTTYAHLSAIHVELGDKVKAGDVVGACGSTGKSTGNHLHFEIFVHGRRVDPAPYIGL